jgi:chemotaxis protein MotA
MLIEGVISIQAGDNPRVVEEKLRTFLDPSERKLLSGDEDTADNVEELRQAA